MLSSILFDYNKDHVKKLTYNFDKSDNYFGKKLLLYNECYRY